MSSCIVIFLLFLLFIMFASFHSLLIPLNRSSIEDESLLILLEKIAKPNYESTNGLSTFMLVGDFTDLINGQLPSSTAIVRLSHNSANKEYQIENVPNYNAHSIFIFCSNAGQLEDALNKAIASPYWYPLAKIIIYMTEVQEAEIYSLFYFLWYHKCANAIIARKSKKNETIVYQYDPYTKIENNDFDYGCWTVQVNTVPISSLRSGIYCERGCANVTFMRRQEYLGTCLKYNKVSFKLENLQNLQETNWFENRARNYNGFSFRAQAVNTPPFMNINVDDEGRYTLSHRDGHIWNTMAQIMNFSIDFSESSDVFQTEHNFERIVRQIYDVAFRKLDLILVPIFRMDLFFVEVDATFPFRDSGVCILAHRAGFQTIFSKTKILTENWRKLTVLGACFLCIWTGYFLFYIADNKSTFIAIGSGFTNTVRTCLSLGVFMPPRSQSFRIILTVTIWGFFVVNFMIQAGVISHFTTAKRGKEVNTFEDIIAKGYPIYGYPTPDVILPDSEKKYIQMNSKLVTVKDMMVCPTMLAEHPKRFCLLECSNARYMEANYLDREGKKYIHVAEDRIHNFYLNFIHYKHSPMTDYFNKYIMAFVEAGLIKKWEEYKYVNLVEERTERPLGLDDFKEVFIAYSFMIILSVLCLLLECTFSFAWNWFYN